MISKALMITFLKGLKARGLTGVRMITSDAHEGIIDAIAKQFPDVPWQRCQFHFSRNITQKTPARYQKGLASELQEMFNCKTIKDAMTVMVLPSYLHKYFRTKNP